MSENLDLVRSICAAWERGDFSSADWADPMIRYVWADGPTPSGSTGVSQMAAGWRAFLDNWMDLRIDVDEYRALADGRVLVLMQRTGRGKASGIELGQMQTHGAAVFGLHDRKVSTLVVYFDRDRALADLGLEGG
jgi:limonene-1,2-epoxide hydrolase